LSVAMSRAEHVEIPTEGMHCRSCEALIELTVGDLEGVLAVTADRASAVTRVDFDPEVISLDAIVDAIRGAGYTARV
ncbi:MAG: cation transporter, partial [Coriobacteriia bacterium]|nr:cation transporter [Coriobacteriia bacterium]